MLYNRRCHIIIGVNQRVSFRKCAQVAVAVIAQQHQLIAVVRLSECLTDRRRNITELLMETSLYVRVFRRFQGCLRETALPRGCHLCSQRLRRCPVVLQHHRQDKCRHREIQIHHHVITLRPLRTTVIFLPGVFRQRVRHVHQKLFLIDDRAVSLLNCIKGLQMLLIHTLKGSPVCFLAEILHRVIPAAVQKLWHPFDSGQVKVHKLFLQIGIYRLYVIILIQHIQCAVQLL